MTQKLRTARDYAKMLTELQDNDMKAADELTIGLAANFSYKNSEYSRLENMKAMYIGNNMVQDEKGKFPPKTRLETQWDASEDGQRMLALYRERQSLKILIQAVQNHSFTMRSEANIH